MRKTKSTRCGKCGSNNPPFTLFVNATTAESYALCINCKGNQVSDSIDNLAEIDAQIAEHEELLKEMEIIVQEAGDMELPPELEAYAFTPLKTFKMIQLTLASLKTKRVELLSSGANEHRLQYELDKKIEDEKYEEAGTIQKKLNDLKTNPKKKKKLVKDKVQKRAVNLFVSEEAAEGRCIRCKDRFPKPPSLFIDFDIGNCQEMCLPCCAIEVPKKVHSVEVVDQMLAEMHRFSKMMNGMSLMGRLMTEGPEKLDYDKEKAALENTIHPESKLIIDRLEIRKDFLLHHSDKKTEISLEKTLIDSLLGEDEHFLNSLLQALDNVKPAKEGQKSIKKKKTKSKKKQRKKKNPSLSARQVIDKGNAWLHAGKEGKKCPKCKEQPVKPVTIFEDYDLGEHQNTCLICSIDTLPLIIPSLEMAAGMMDEMQRISDYLDELVVLAELQEAGELDKASQIDIKEMEVEVKLPEQVIARKILEAIQMRKTFLEGVGENEDLINLADNFIRNLRSKRGG